MAEDEKPSEGEEQPEEEQTPLTKEELETKRKELEDYYDKRIPLLEKQLDYEKLLTEISDLRTKRIQNDVFAATVMAGPPEEGEEEGDPGDGTPPEKRTLKRPDEEPQPQV